MLLLSKKIKMTEFSDSLKKLHIKKKLLNQSPSQKREQSNDHLFIVRKQNASTSKSFHYWSAAVLTPRPCLSVDAQGLFLGNVLNQIHWSRSSFASPFTTLLKAATVQVPEPVFSASRQSIASQTSAAQLFLWSVSPTAPIICCLENFQQRCTPPARYNSGASTHTRLFMQALQKQSLTVFFGTTT